MSARYDEEWTASLLDPERRLGALNASEFLVDAGLQQRMTVIDYGCGPGFFTLPAANIVGLEGKVYALDIEPKMVTLVAERAAAAGLGNVTAVLNEGFHAPLPDAAADFALCCQVFHYAEERDGRLLMARDLGRLVKAGGHAVIVQWRDKMSYEETAAVLSKAGFDCDGPFETKNNQFKAIATRRQRQ